MIEHFVRPGISTGKGGIEHRTQHTIWTNDLQFERTNRSIAVELVELVKLVEFEHAPGRIHNHFAETERREVFEGLYAEHPQECGIRINDLFAGIRNVDPLAQIAHETFQAHRVIERGEIRRRPCPRAEGAVG